MWGVGILQSERPEFSHLVSLNNVPNLPSLRFLNCNRTGGSPSAPRLVFGGPAGDVRGRRSGRLLRGGGSPFPRAPVLLSPVFADAPRSPRFPFLTRALAAARCCISGWIRTRSPGSRREVTRPAGAGRACRPAEGGRARPARLPRPRGRTASLCVPLRERPRERPLPRAPFGGSVFPVVSGRAQR